MGKKSVAFIVDFIMILVAGTLEACFSKIFIPKMLYGYFEKQDEYLESVHY